MNVIIIKNMNFLNFKEICPSSETFCDEMVQI